MFPPLAKLRWASLPKINKRFFFIPLLVIFFFASSPFAYALAAPQVITPQKGADGENYLLIPVSDLEQDSGQYRVRRPAATAGGQLEGGQVLGFADMIGWIWDKLTNFGEKIGDVAKCAISPGKCAVKGMRALFDFGTIALQKLVLNQIGGEATDCFIPSEDPNDPSADPTADHPEHCEEIDKAIAAYQRGEPVSVDPAKFGVLGIAATTTTTALAMPLPMNTTTYLASINPFAKASATQGTDELADSDVVLDIWTKVRDGSYILLVVAIVIVGFMIMFRMPIGPRTAVTVQNSLPRIAISMLLITFSFLIAGLMLDATRVVADLMQSFLPSISVTGAGAGAAALLGVLIIFLIALFSITSMFFTPIAGAIVVIAVLLLIIFALLAIFVIITFKLVSRLVIFLLMVMFAPLFFLAGALPKGEGAIIFWFKRTASALLAIPATGFVIALALVIGSSGVQNIDLGFAVTGLPAEGFAGGVVDLFSWAFAAPIIGLVLLSFAIKTPNIVDELFGIKDFGSRAGGLGMVFGAPGKAFKAAGDVGRTMQYTRSAREGVGRALQSVGWRGGASGARTSGEIPAGVSARSISPKWSKTLQKAGLMQERGKVPAGIPASSLPDDYRNLLQQEGLLHTPAGAAGPVTKEGTIAATTEGTVEGPPPKRTGFKAAAARTISRGGGPLFGGKPPSGRPTFKTAEQLRRESEDLDAAAKASPGRGASVPPEDEKRRGV